MTLFEAKNSCAVLNGVLPCVRSYEQNEAILSRLNGMTIYIHIHHIPESGCANDRAIWLANNDIDLSCKSNFLYWGRYATNYHHIRF